MKAHDFVAGIAIASKIKIITDDALGEKTLTSTAIYNFIKKVKAGKTTNGQRH
jgi:hypothetical protein